MSYLDDPGVLKAALVIVGNEILSGRTQDKNAHWIAENLGRYGIALVEVRVVPDIEDKIIAAVNDLRVGVDYVFTTGGIGPTHDDITAESVAKAFGMVLEYSQEAHRMLVEYYGSEEEVTQARAKMAMIPKGAGLIPNPVSGAPGFIIGNVYVMAGVPRIMQAMFDHVVKQHLRTGKIVMSNTVMFTLPESRLAEVLSAVQEKYDMIDIGSYPHFRDGTPSVSVVLRGTDEASLKASTKEVIERAAKMGGAPSALSLQVVID